MELSEKLKNARISRKLSQKTLAESLGVSRATLSLWESGSAIPPVQYLRKYQELFKFKKGYFEKDTPAENMAFDISRLNENGIAELKDFYNSLLSRKECLKKS